MTTKNYTTLSQRLTDNYSALRAAIEGAFESAEEVAHAKTDLRVAQQRIINEHSDDPKRLGANEAARTARIDELTSDFRLELQRAEEDERRTRHALELARLDLEATKAQVRILELTAREVTA